MREPKSFPTTHWQRAQGFSWQLCQENLDSPGCYGSSPSCPQWGRIYTSSSSTLRPWSGQNCQANRSPWGHSDEHPCSCRRVVWKSLCQEVFIFSSFVVLYHRLLSWHQTNSLISCSCNVITSKHSHNLQTKRVTYLSSFLDLHLQLATEVDRNW